MRQLFIAWGLVCAAQAFAGEAELRVLNTGDIGVLLSVQARLGERPLRWLVDSGSSHNLLNLSVPAPASTPPQELYISSAAGRLRGTSVELGTLHIAGEAVAGQTALRLDLGSVLGPLARQVDGVLGMPFLQGRRLLVDFPRRTISFDAPPLPADRGVAVERVHGLPVVNVELQGQAQRLLFDTGAAGGVVRLQRTSLFARSGVWLAPQLQVAGVPRRQVPVADLPGTALARNLPDEVRGALGMAVLEGCRFTLDLAGNRLEVQGCSNDSLPGGFGLQWSEQGQRLVLAYVWPDSPAAKSGLKAGDRVQSLAGAAAPASVPEADALIAGAQHIDLEVERDGRVIAVALQRAYFLPPLPER